MSDKKLAIKHELWRRGVLSWKLHSVQLEMYETYRNAKENSTLVWLLARQSGKCLAEGTMVSTPSGAVEINKLKAGDTVYGYNKDGSVSPTRVVTVQHQGTKEVHDLTNHGRVMASATSEHRWGGFNTLHKKDQEFTTEDLVSRDYRKILRRYPQVQMGTVNEPHAYAIGALLGDGCSKQRVVADIHISSENSIIPAAVADVLGCSVVKQSPQNHTWSITNETANRKRGRDYKPVQCNYYDDWMRDRYAHEKIINLDVIKTWDRESCLKLLAGLIDTDGGLMVCGRKKNELKLHFASQSKSIIDAMQYLTLSMFQTEFCYTLDDRKKYKNGPLHVIYLNNNFFVSKILKEISPYIKTPRKQWKPQYEAFVPHNPNPDYCGVKKGKTYKASCWDIQVDNDTNLYLLANGLVTHNSTLMGALALEQALSKPHSVIKLLTDTKIHAKTIFDKIFIELLSDCPEDIRPSYIESQYTYKFPNGSEIQMAGTDSGHYERLRGSKTHLALIDEAGFCTNLEDIVKSVLIPTTTHTGGKIILASTPPADGRHDFLKFIEAAQYRGNLTKKTIYDNPLLNEDQVRRIEDEMGGRNSVKFRREYECEIVKDEDTVLFPEFNAELKPKVCIEWKKPAYYDSYVAMDLGGRDSTAVLFGYYDFKKDKIIIDDEIVVPGRKLKLPDLVNDIIKKEEELFTNPVTNEFMAPYKRVSDINYIVTDEIRRMTNNRLMFDAPRKDDKMAAVNNLRVLLASEKIIINPKCETLIRHLENVKWDTGSKSTNFARSPDDSHYDSCDALIYMVRSINFNKNPYPPGYGYDQRDLFVYNKDSYYKNDPMQIYQKIFNRKRK